MAETVNINLAETGLTHTIYTYFWLTYVPRVFITSEFPRGQTGRISLCAFHRSLARSTILHITFTPIRRHHNQRNLYYYFVLCLAVVTCAVWIYDDKKYWKPSAHRKYIAAHHPAPSLYKTTPCKIYCTVPVDNK